LEKVLAMEWFAEFADAKKARAAGDGSKFQAYTLTQPDSPKIAQEIKEIMESHQTHEEKKERAHRHKPQLEHKE
jgi:hypothetical protein